MKPSVYLETTISSYLASEVSSNLITAGHQRVTHEWWSTRREFYDLYASQVVLEEARHGDPDLARRRLGYLEGIEVLELRDDARSLAREIISIGVLPETASVDGLHVALAAVSGMDYLLTWNCKHLANASIRPRIETVCRANRYEPPVICTPEELME